MTSWYLLLSVMILERQKQTQRLGFVILTHFELFNLKYYLFSLALPLRLTTQRLVLWSCPEVRSFRQRLEVTGSLSLTRPTTRSPAPG